MSTSGSGGFGEASSEMAPPPQEKISEGGRAFTPEPSLGGLALPTSVVDARNAQRLSERPEVNNGILQPEEPAEADPKDKTPEERVKNVDESMESMAEDNEAVLTAENEEELSNALINGAIESGEDPEVAKEKTNKLLERAAGLAGMTFDAFKEANKGSDAGLFIKFLFDIYSNPDGRYGSSAFNELKGNISKDDAYLVQALGKVDEGSLKRFFTETLGENIDSLDDIKGLMKKVQDDLNMKDWGEMKGKLNNFLLIVRPQAEDYDFDEENIKGIFEKFNDKSADQLRSMFNLETSETSDEGDGSDDDTSGADDNSVSGTGGGDLQGESIQPEDSSTKTN